jgi:hypothetical protein
MDRINWEESDVREIKLELKREKWNLAERLSRRFGVDTESVRQKIREIELTERLHKLL